MSNTYNIEECEHRENIEFFREHTEKTKGEAVLWMMLIFHI